MHSIQDYRRESNYTWAWMFVCFCPKKHKLAFNLPSHFAGISLLWLVAKSILSIWKPTNKKREQTRTHIHSCGRENHWNWKKATNNENVNFNKHNLWKTWMLEEQWNHGVQSEPNEFLCVQKQMTQNNGNQPANFIIYRMLSSAHSPCFLPATPNTFALLSPSRSFSFKIEMNSTSYFFLY